MNFFWLVEWFPANLKLIRPFYFLGPDRSGMGFCFTDLAHRAARWELEQDAKNTAAALPTTSSGHWAATEHGFAKD